MLWSGWDRRFRRNRLEGGGVEVPTVVGAGSGELSLSLEVQQVAGSGGLRQFHWCCGGRGLFVSVQQE